MGKEWTRVPHDEKVFGGGADQVMHSVTAGGPGLVAVGSDGPEDDSDAAVWLSEDGRSWARVPRDEKAFGGAGEQEMNSVTAGGPGLVAVGDDCTVDYDCDAAVWLSEGGRSWSRVPHDEKTFGGEDDQEMSSVTAGGPGLVAVGSDGYFDGDTDAAVWLSKDGRSWTRVPHDEKIFGAKGELVMNYVTVGGPGLVAVGDGGDAVVWLSKDGHSWTRVHHDEKVFGGGGMSSVTTGGPGLVAVGSDGDFYGDDCDAAVWLSKDGRSWTRVPRDEKIFGGRDYQQMLSVTNGGPGLVAVGDDCTDDYDCDAAVWFSPPGSGWWGNQR